LNISLRDKRIESSWRVSWDKQLVENLICPPPVLVVGQASAVTIGTIQQRGYEMTIYFVLFNISLSKLFH